MRLCDLASDALRMICDKLHAEEIAKLYATNDRSLMRRIVSRDICPTIHSYNTPTSTIVRLITEHSNLRTFSCFSVLDDLNRPESSESSYSNCYVEHRIVLGLPRSLTSLELSMRVDIFDSLQPVSETFASLFPNLKSLSLRMASLSDVYLPVAAYVAQLMNELPPNLDTLDLSGNYSVPIESLPRALTTLRVAHPTAIATLAKYPLRNPTYELIKCLHTATPNLRTLWTTLSGRTDAFDQFPPGRRNGLDGEELEIFLPELTYLGLRGNSAISEELEDIITSLPSVTTLYIAASLGSYGHEVLPDQILSPQCVRSVFPPKLTSLTVGPVTSQLARVSLEKYFFKSLPSTLTSLSLRFCTMAWTRRAGQGWEPVTVPPSNGTGFRFGTPYAMDDDENELPEYASRECWTALLPRTLEHLSVVASDPVHVSLLPSSLRVLSITNAEGSNEYPDPTTEIMPQKEPDFKSELRWPPLLQDLKILHRRLTLADALSLPPSLTRLKMAMSFGWNQFDAKELLDHLPNCSVDAESGAHLWVTNPPSSSSMESDASDGPMPTTKDGKFDFDGFLQLRLSSLPRRIFARWKLSIPDTSELGSSSGASSADLASMGVQTRDAVPHNLRTLSIPQHWDIRSVVISKVESDIHFSHGQIKLHPSSIFQLLIPRPSLVEIVEVPSKRTGLVGFFSQPLMPSLLSNFSNLTVMELQTPHTLPPVFLDLPRTLTRLSVGLPRVTRPNQHIREHFNAWRLIHRPNIASPEGNSGFFNFARASEEEAERRLKTISKVDDLPRGLVHLDVSSCVIPAICDGDWPRSIKKLSFTSSDWTDKQVARLPNRFDQQVDISINGLVFAFGSQPLPSPITTMDVDTSANAQKPTEEEMSDATEKMNLGADTRSPIEPTTALDSINVITLGSQLTAPFIAQQIDVELFAIPSIFSFASSSLHTLQLCGNIYREFRMISRGSNRINLHPFGNATPCQLDTRIVRELNPHYFGSPALKSSNALTTLTSPSSHLTTRSLAWPSTNSNSLGTKSFRCPKRSNMFRCALQERLAKLTWTPSSDYLASWRL